MNLFTAIEDTERILGISVSYQLEGRCDGTMYLLTHIHHIISTSGISVLQDLEIIDGDSGNGTSAIIYGICILCIAPSKILERRGSGSGHDIAVIQDSIAGNDITVIIPSLHISVILVRKHI